MPFTLIVILAFLARKWKKNLQYPASFAYLLSMLIGAGVPLAFGHEYSLFMDVVIAVMIVVTMLVSTLNVGRYAESIQFQKSTLSNLYSVGIIITGLLFLLPGFIVGDYPVLVAMDEGLLSANLLRQTITKESFAAQIFLMLVFRFGMMLPAFSIGYMFSTLSNWDKSKYLLCLVYAAIVSLAYVQKSNPLFIIVAFVIGLILSGTITKKTMLIIAIVIPMSLAGIGALLYGPTLAISFMNDMLFRRLVDVPLDMLIAHFEYYDLHDTKFLKHSFTFLTGNEALPRLVYMQLGGSLSLGWANCLYIGDLIINFGLFGGMIITVILGLIIRSGNRVAVSDQKFFGKNVALFALGSFIFSLSNNALFSSVQFILLGLFFVVMILKGLLNAK